MTLLGAGLAGCGAPVRPRAPYRGLSLPPVRASRDRVVRTLVGLRPFRPLGIRVEAERIGSRTLIHNYGHGGAGVSLSWGTGRIAAEKAVRAGGGRAAVIGAGAVGLATARELQRKGFEVTIYTRAVWPDPSVCSGVAPARFTPSFSIIEPEHRTPGFDSLYERAAEYSYRMWNDLVGPRYGVSWRYRYSLRDGAPDPPGSGGGSSLGVEEALVLGPREHPFPTRYALRRPTLTIDTPLFLEATLGDFLAWGGRLVIRTFEDPDAVRALEEPVIVNCSGLGARRVAGDRDLVPLRGQLTVLLPQPEVDFIVTGGGTSVVPRANGLLLGGAPNRRGDWSMEVDEPASRRVVEEAEELLGRMREVGEAGSRRREPRAPGPARRVAGEEGMRGQGARGRSSHVGFSADELSTRLAF